MNVNLQKHLVCFYQAHCILIVHYRHVTGGGQIRFQTLSSTNKQTCSHPVTHCYKKARFSNSGFKKAKLATLFAKAKLFLQKKS